MLLSRIKAIGLTIFHTADHPRGPVLVSISFEKTLISLQTSCKT